MFSQDYNYIWLDKEGIKDLSQRVVFANSPKTANNKPVIQFDMNNNIVNRYGSVKEACERNKYKSPNISACCRGEQKQHMVINGNMKEKMNMYSFNADKTKNDCVQFIKDFFEENGKECNAVIGISGGVDSSVVAALCVEALGKDKVFGVLMPHGEQKDISDAIKLVDFLDIDYITVNIFNAVRAIKHEVKPALHDRWSRQTSINLPPRIRMATLYAVSQTMNGRVANTCNLSEDYIGYSTRYGDSVGDFSPLSYLTKTEVKEIGYELGLPKDLIEKVPEDGLCGKTDEENFGFTYKVLDKYIRTGEIEDNRIKEKIDSMHVKNLFKLKMMDSFLYPPIN